MEISVILQIKRFEFSVVLIVILLISSCTNMGTGINTSVVTAESTDASTAMPENTSTPRPLPTETKPAPAPLAPVKTQCAGNSNESQKLDLEGVVAFAKAGEPDSFEFGLFLLNLKNGNTIREVYEGLLAQVSPDRKYLAYEYLKGDVGFLSVLNSNGKTISDFNFLVDGKIQSFFNWQNAEQLRTIQQSPNWKIIVQLLNPLTQKSMALRTDWDGVYAPKNPFNDNLVQWKFDEKATEIFFVYGANILYDPSLTRVLYPKDGGVVSLVTVENERELASAQFENWGRLPSWSPDGEYLTIVNREGNTDEFYLISKSGNEFQKITNFSQELDFGFVPEYSWSPDSKQIVFWLNTETAEIEDGGHSELAILDIASKQVTTLCIQGISKNAYHPWTMNHPEPIWSPDGRYIMITQWDDPAAPKKYDVLVVDPITGAVEKISENTAPIGWMISEP